MAHLPELKLRHFDGGHQVTEKYCILTPIKPEKDIIHRFYSLFTNGLLVLEEGYAYNGANIIKDTKKNLTCAGIHDAFCQMVEDGDLPHSARWAADEFWHETLVMAGFKGIELRILSDSVKAYGRLKYR